MTTMICVEVANVVVILLVIYYLTSTDTDAIEDPSYFKQKFI